MATLLPKIVLPPTTQIEDHVSAEPAPEGHVSESAKFIDVSGSSSDGKVEILDTMPAVIEVLAQVTISHDANVSDKLNMITATT